ncbi:hypothetical protein [Demequina activiva]|uniref:SseB protein N-terminal domain-containing protein n=1 Tax=Demequina activiva TaxID=1582364 RepID=A0A919Q2U5_9MICO|nr:hypothetical protein [Demequina activiva]GIG53856.1 hypothetical protein Dac01nite_06080 [Demequina activiva]
MPTDNDVFNSLVNEPVDDPGVAEALGRLFARLTVAVPSSTDPSGPEGMTPLTTELDGVPHVMVATSSAALESAGKIASFAIETTGAGAIGMIAPGWGIVADTGRASCAFSPQRLAALRAESTPE